MRTFGLPPVVDQHVPLVVRQLDEVFAAHGAVILLVLVALLVLLQRVLHLELLPAGVARVGLLVDAHVRLQFLWTAEGPVTLRTRPVVLLQMNRHVLVEVFWEGEVLLTVGTLVAFAARRLAVGHYVPFQVIHATKHFAAVSADQAARTGLLDLLV